MADNKKNLKGLLQYEKDDSSFFFGRDKEIESALEILKKNKILTITGSPSSGKSSFVESGIINRISNNFPGKSGKSWSFCTFRPGFTPIENLCKSLSTESSLYLNSKPTTSDFDDYSQIIANKQGFGLINIYKNSEIFNKKNLLIHIDNVEDLFKYTKIYDNQSKKDDDLLIDIIDKSIRNEFCSIYFIITVQADYLSKLNIYGKFSELLSLSQFNLPGVNMIEFYNNISDYLNFNINKNVFNSIIEQGYEKPFLITNFQFLLKKAQTDFINTSESDIESFFSKKALLDNIISNSLEKYLTQLSKDDYKDHIKLFRALINSDIENNKVYFQKFSYIKNYIGKDSKYITDLILNFNKKFGFLLDSFSENISPIVSKSNFVFNDDSIIILKHHNCLNWKTHKLWEKEESNTYETLIHLKIKESEKENLTNSEIDDGLDLINKEFTNNYWSDKYGISFLKIKNYILNQKQIYDNEILEKNNFIKTSKKRILILKVVGLGIVVLFGYLAITSYIEKEELKNISLEKETIQRINDTLERNILAQKQEIKSIIKTIELEKDTIDNFRNKFKIQQKIIDNKNIKIINDREKINYQREEIISKEIKFDSVENRLGIANLFLEITKQEISLNNEIKNLSRQIRLIENSQKEKISEFANFSIQLFDNFIKIQDEKKSLIDNYSNELERYNSLIIKTTNNDKNNLRKLGSSILSKIYGVDKVTQIQEFNLLRKVTKNQEKKLNLIQISDYGRILAGGESNRIYYSANKNEKIEEIDFDFINLNSELKSIAFLNNDFLYAGLKNGEIWLIDLQKKQKVKIYPTKKLKQTGPINDLISVNSDIYFTNKYMLIKYNIKNQLLTRFPINDLGSDELLQITYNGEKIIYMLTKDGKIFDFNINDNSNTLRFDSNKGYDFSKNDKVSKISYIEDKFLFATKNGWIYLYNANSKNLEFNQKYLAHDSKINTLYYDKRLKTLYSSADDGSFCIVELNEGNTFSEKRVDIDFGSNSIITDIKSYKYNDKDYILTSDINGNLSYWDLEISKMFELIKKRVLRKPLN